MSGGDVLRRRPDTALVGEELRGQDPEDERDQRLTRHLGPTAQTLVVLGIDLDEVVEEPHYPAAEEEQHQEPSAGTRPPAGQDRCRQICRSGTQQDHETAHGRRTPLDMMCRRSVVPDRLAEAATSEPSDSDSGPQQRADRRQRAAQEYCPHRYSALSAIRVVDPFEQEGVVSPIPAYENRQAGQT